MKPLILPFLCLVCCVFFSSPAFAQDKTVHGTVAVFDSIPLIGVEIQVKSTKQVTQTDSLGNFYAFCNSTDRLKITADGFLTEKVDVSKQTKYIAVNLRLKGGNKAQEHALGYARVNDRDKLNAIASINSEEMEFGRYASMYDLLQGKFAGVQVINGQVVIRGIKANSNSAALIVVDGIQRNNSVLSAISPTQVKSVNIIKDSGASIYGMKGANGVVVIETKKGGKE